MIEYANEGYDVVNAAITYVLADNVEELNLLGTQALAGTGNAQDNRITGNAAANVLHGMAGNDTLAGGAGNDTYRFTLQDGQDVIDNRTAGATDVDILELGEQVSFGVLFFARSGNDLVIRLLDAGDAVTAPDAFVQSANLFDQIVLGTQVLEAAQVTQLIQDLSVFQPDSSNGGGLSAQQRIEITGIVTEAFQAV